MVKMKTLRLSERQRKALRRSVAHWERIVKCVSDRRFASVYAACTLASPYTWSDFTPVYLAHAFFSRASKEVSGREEGMSSSCCPLCALYAGSSGDSYASRCSSCPVSLVSGAKCCRSTPFIPVMEALQGLYAAALKKGASEEETEGSRVSLEEAASCELSFLRGILEEY